MEYNKLVAVSGLPGLYELVSSKNDGAVVRSLTDKTTKFASSRIHQFSHLESIEIYTTGENVNLVDIFKAMEAGGNLPDAKDDKGVKDYFKKVYPDMDFDRVYTSDMKKMIKWYEVLKKNDVEIKLSNQEEEPSEEVEQTPEPVADTAQEPEPVEKKKSVKAKKEIEEEKDIQPAKAPKKKAAKKEVK